MPGEEPTGLLDVAVVVQVGGVVKPLGGVDVRVELPYVYSGVMVGTVPPNVIVGLPAVITSEEMPPVTVSDAVPVIVPTTGLLPEPVTVWGPEFAGVQVAPVQVPSGLMVYVMVPGSVLLPKKSTPVAV